MDEVIEQPIDGLVLVEHQQEVDEHRQIGAVKQLACKYRIGALKQLRLVQ